MSDRIDKIRSDRARFRIDGDDLTHATDLPLDHQLTFCPSSNEQWTFEDGRIFLNGDDVGEMINESSDDIHCLSNLSHALDQYRQYVWQTGGKSLAKYNGTVNALLEKVLGRLGNIYEGLVGGVKFEYSNGNFWVNNINVRSMLRLYQLRPTRKARCYLVGLRNKLSLIINGSNGNGHYDGISDEAGQLFNEISCALDQIPTDDGSFCLPPHSNC